MFLENDVYLDGDWDELPLLKAVHSIYTTVSTLHGITPIEVVIGRPVNEKSILPLRTPRNQTRDNVQASKQTQYCPGKAGNGIGED